MVNYYRICDDGGIPNSERAEYILRAKRSLEALELNWNIVPINNGGCPSSCIGERCQANHGDCYRAIINLPNAHTTISFKFWAQNNRQGIRKPDEIDMCSILGYIGSITHKNSNQLMGHLGLMDCHNTRTIARNLINSARETQAMFSRHTINSLSQTARY